MPTRIPIQMSGSAGGPHYWSAYLESDACAYQLNHVQRPPQTWPTMSAVFKPGLLGHAMLEHYYADGPYDVFDVEFIDDAGDLLGVDDELATSVILSVDEFIGAQEFPLDSVVAVEHPLQPKQFGLATVSGRIDLLVDTRGLWVIDYKFLLPHTSDESQVKLVAQYKASVQLATYVQSAARELGRDVKGAKIVVLNKCEYPSHYILDYTASELLDSATLAQFYTKALVAKEADKRNFKACRKWGPYRKALCPHFQACCKLAAEFKEKTE